jgi:hypothetical protein
LEFLLNDDLDKSRINILLSFRILENILKVTRSNKIKKYLNEKIKKKLLKMISSIKETKHKKDMDNYYMAKLIEDIFNTSYDITHILRNNRHCIYNFEFEYKQNCINDLFLIKHFDNTNILFEDEMFLFCHLIYFFEKNFDFMRKKFHFKAFYNNFYMASLFSKIHLSKSYKMNTKNYQMLLMIVEENEKIKHVNW